MKLFVLLLGCVVLISCSHQDRKKWRKADDYQRSRYVLKQDAVPRVTLNPDDIADAVPRAEPRLRAGNISPYTVFGKTYKVLSTSKNYKATGEASWYGMKFNGYDTANGEKYDINGMTAAHKTLPIPSYVRVTNLSNNKTCVVRVNDRGPFNDRLIDLSYAAAVKLGFHHAGTTRVRVEAIDTEALPPLKSVANKMIFLQVGAYHNIAIAKQQYAKLQGLYGYRLALKSSKDNYHRLFIGPVNKRDIDKIVAELKAAGYPKPLLVDKISNL